MEVEVKPRMLILEESLNLFVVGLILWRVRRDPWDIYRVRQVTGVRLFRGSFGIKQ
ncbi:hypothetical protein LINPERHAP2_LOCUS23043, partial [Linum perenne]